MMLKAACILLFIGFATPDSSISSVVSRILNLAKRSGSHSPVILVINSRPSESSSVEVNQQSSDDDKSLSNFLAQINKHRTRDTQKRYRARPDDYSAYSVQNRQTVKVPLYKSLLSLRNSLRCGARDECQDECSQTFVGKKKDKCKVTCEVKFDCESEEDECKDSNDCDETGSTKGPPASEEKPFGCPRC